MCQYNQLLTFSIEYLARNQVVGVQISRGTSKFEVTSGGESVDLDRVLAATAPRRDWGGSFLGVTGRMLPQGMTIL
jgi:hypothetical protein